MPSTPKACSPSGINNVVDVSNKLFNLSWDVSWGLPSTSVVSLSKTRDNVIVNSLPSFFVTSTISNASTCTGAVNCKSFDNHTGFALAISVAANADWAVVNLNVKDDVAAVSYTHLTLPTIYSV